MMKMNEILLIDNSKMDENLMPKDDRPGKICPNAHMLMEFIKNITKE